MIVVTAHVLDSISMFESTMVVEGNIDAEENLGTARHVALGKSRFHPTTVS